MRVPHAALAGIRVATDLDQCRGQSGEYHLLVQEWTIWEMTMKKAVVFVAALLCGALLSFGSPGNRGLALGDSAEARVGRPATATSVAGVARRTSRRAVRRCAAGVTC
jgi:hypothetical protein